MRACSHPYFLSDLNGTSVGEGRDGIGLFHGKQLIDGGLLARRNVMEIKMLAFAPFKNGRIGGSGEMGTFAHDGVTLLLKANSRKIDLRSLQIAGKEHPLAIGLQKEGEGMRRMLRADGTHAEGAVVEDLALLEYSGAKMSGTLAVKHAVPGKEPVEKSLLRGEDMGIGIFEIPGKEVCGAGKARYVVAMNVGNENGSEAIGMYTAANEKINEGATGIYGVILAARLNNGAGAKAILFRNAVTGAFKIQLHLYSP